MGKWDVNLERENIRDSVSIIDRYDEKLAFIREIINDKKNKKIRGWDGKVCDYKHLLDSLFRSLYKLGALANMSREQVNHDIALAGKYGRSGELSKIEIPEDVHEYRKKKSVKPKIQRKVCRCK